MTDTSLAISDKFFRVGQDNLRHVTVILQRILCDLILKLLSVDFNDIDINVGY